MPRLTYPDLGVRHLTFSCQHRLDLFVVEPLFEQLAHQLASCREVLGIKIIAWVAMPSHVHLVVDPCGVGVDRILKCVKQPVSFHALSWLEQNRPDLFSQLRVYRGDRTTHKLWLPGGGYDRLVRGEDQLRETVKYIHRNPVRKELVERPEQWKWSSFRFYLTGVPDPIECDREGYI